MSDIADKAEGAIEVLNSVTTRKMEAPQMPTGTCFWCGEPVPPGHRWCDSYCRDDWQRDAMMKDRCGR